MNTTAPSAAPSWAISCWVDNHTLYFELRGANGPSVVGFARHELSKALSILFANYEQEGHGEVYIRPPNISKKMIEAGVTTDDLASAREALKQMGILK